MTNSILIGKLIYNAIMDDDVLTEAVHYTERDERTKSDIDKYGVFPLVASKGAPFPFIVYARTNIYSDGRTKDGAYGDRVTFQVSVASDQYFESTELANEVRDLFENCVLYDETLRIDHINMTSITESFIDDTYIQTLNFECSAE